MSDQKKQETVVWKYEVVEGQEYEVVGRCVRTGLPVSAPRSWNHKVAPRPTYYSCSCHGRK